MCALSEILDRSPRWEVLVMTEVDVPRTPERRKTQPNACHAVDLASKRALGNHCETRRIGGRVTACVV